MNIKGYPLNEIGTNCYFVYNDEHVIIVDPSGDPGVIFEEIEHLGVNVAGVLLTHAHWDHIIALEAVLDRYDVKVYGGQEENNWLEDPIKNLSNRGKDMGHDEIALDVVPEVLHEREETVGSITFDVIKTPGHSPGSLSFKFKDFVISGDALFKDGIGRTDLPGSNYEELMYSIKEKLFALDDNMVVYPGHGESTTIGYEKENNPFLK